MQGWLNKSKGVGRKVGGAAVVCNGGGTNSDEEEAAAVSLHGDGRKYCGGGVFVRLRRLSCRNDGNDVDEGLHVTL